MSETRKPFLDALHGDVAERPPFWLMRQAGRYLPEYRAVRSHASGFLDLCYTPELAAEVTLQPVRRFRTDAAILFSDILVVPHALGQRLSFTEGEGPRLDPIRSPVDLSRLSPDGFVQRLSPVYDTVRLVAGQLTDGVALIGFSGSPWTLACYMIEGGSTKEFAQVKLWALRHPDSFSVLIGLLVDAVTEHLSQQIQAGAEAVQLFDSWAGLLPEDQFRRWVIAPTRAIADRLRQRHAGVPIIGFPRGAGFQYSAYANEAGVDAVGLDTVVPVGWAVKSLGLPVQGNLDPVRLLAGGEVLVNGVKEILEVFRGHSAVFNLGHGVLPQTPPDHVAELARLIRGEN